MSRYQTINQTAKNHELNPWMLRTMQKRGELPGFFSGSRYYVDTVLLMEKLENASKASMTRPEVKA